MGLNISIINGRQTELFQYIFSLVCLDQLDELVTALSGMAVRDRQKILSMVDTEDSSNGMTLLMYAAYFGKHKICEYLLNFDLDLNRTDAKGKDVLHHAIRSREPELVSLFVEKVCVNRPDRSGVTKIAEAIRCSNVGSVRKIRRSQIKAKENGLDKKGADREKVIKRSDQKLIDSEQLKSSNIEIVKTLLNQGADPSIADCDGVRPLHSAVDLLNVPVVRLLLAKKCDPNSKDKWGWTPMHIASAQNHVELLKLLNNRGGNINITDKCGNTPLQWAMQTESKATIAYLTECGGRIYNSDKKLFDLEDLTSYLTHD